MSSVCDRTQTALKIVEKWCNEIKLPVNPSKTDSLVFTKKRDLKSFKAPKIFGKYLERDDRVKYLGVTLTPRLNWNDHINDRLMKCHRVFWSCRSAILKNWALRPSCILWLNTAIIRPMLVYGSFIWWRGATSSNMISKLSHLQRTACLMVTGAKSTTPQAALNAFLLLPPLEIFIESEARSTAFRLRSIILEWQLSIRDSHSSILNVLRKEGINLSGQTDTILPNYFFNNRFKVLKPSVEEWENGSIQEQQTGNTWYTSAFVSSGGCGFGVVNTNNNFSLNGFLGENLDPKQAELASFQICSISTGNCPAYGYDINIYTDSTAVIRALKETKIKSRLTSECIEILNSLSERGNINIVWCPSSSKTHGMAVANLLGRRGSESTLWTPQQLGPYQAFHH